MRNLTSSAPSDLQIAFDQCVLRRIAFAGIADDDEAEVPVIDARWRHPKQLVDFPAIGRHDAVDHAGTPCVDAQFGHLLIESARPAFRVEVPGESPDRVDGDEQHGEWQTKANATPAVDSMDVRASQSAPEKEEACVRPFRQQTTGQ